MPALEWNKLRAPQLRTLATEDSLVIISAGSTEQNVLHAGEAETSMLLHLKPELVDQNTLPTADGPSELKLMGPGAYRWQSFKKLSPNGVIGFPSAATPKKGERLLESAASGLCRMLTDPETWSD